jgi:Nuclease-related domain
MVRGTDTMVSRQLRERRRTNQLSANARAGAHSRRALEATKVKWLRTNWRAAAILIGSCVAIAVVAQVVAPSWIVPYMVGAILASGPWLLYTTMLETDGGNAARSGVLGEELTAQQLRRLAGGWRIVNHVMLEATDVDHAALGPNGFFAIETKYRSDWKAATPYFDAIAAQARKSALGLRGRLGRTSQTVQPVVAMWGPGLQDAFPEVFTYADVTFCPGRLLRQHLASLPERVGAADIQTAFDGLDRYIERRDQGELNDAGPTRRSLNDRVNDASAVLVAVTLAPMVLLFVPGGIIGKTFAAVALIAVAFWFRLRGPGGYRTRLVANAVIIATVGIALAVPAAAMVISLRR